jgi:sec-independent protein translocase protein TatB
MSFSDTVFIFFLALIIFGPKKLPEMARKAGQLLAELRRASNEFKSQIETEIAHLEVKDRQTVLPPSPPPQGTVASLSVNPAVNESLPHPPVALATLAAHTEDPAPAPSPNLALADTSATSTGSSDTAVEPNSPTSQESHV